jgi:phosphoribosylformylglycinamidine synthase I
MRVSVLQFPGSNCDHDVLYAFGTVLGCNTSLVWHGDTQLPEDTSLVIVPGGFSYGDYLRCGAIAAHSPIMAAAKKFAEQGGAIVGICNGFQILTESRLLPGALLRNEKLSFVCKNVTLRVDSQKSPLTAKLPLKSTYTMPVAHMEGNFTADEATLDAMEKNGQIVLRYVDAHGEATHHANPNGAARNIAGVSNEKGNVIGLMPHPERAIEALLGGKDGRTMLTALMQFIRG